MAWNSVKTHSVFSKEEFYGLPTFPEAEGKKYSAIVTGANGITGSHMLRVLAEAPERWGTIYALSRRPPTSFIDGNIKYLSVDFLEKPEEIAKTLKEHVLEVDYAFFTSYIQPPGVWSDTDELERLNTLLLSNFLSALTLAQQIPKRILLQTGAKNYGLHIGPAINPQEESNPRATSAPNFYYPQEDLLWNWCRENNTEWNVTRPAFIIGAVRDAAINIAYGFSLYAAIQKELGGSLDFFGDLAAWDVEKHQSNALLIGYHAEWAVLTPSTRNQALNIADGGVFTYGQFWPVLAALYGIPYNVPESDDAKYQTVEMPISPPPRGFGPAGKFRTSGTYVEWANRPEVKQAWETLKARHNLAPKPDPFDKIPEIFSLLDIDVLGCWGRSLSMNRSRKQGWNGYIDSCDSFIRTFEELSALKMIPPFKRPEKIEVKHHGY
ncbi:hypothetical protein TGAM01_v203495 [Trichoderma gamsii]|uniref:PRISE-like Rossmann-fold domain-containing protein n=1 Tax=Trichoderma gamsii TaxID=398673 RepID=A0A2P4ZTX5_9HYPO|nr:hypothetical protein TGAM01_v203495 [Trichoderma gamsii]PON27728.1 hypothetical protein TGAM01_v203495 [Trichoderma gamsii]